MSEYVPTTGQIARAYADGLSGTSRTLEESHDEFWNWLTAHDAEVAAKALSDAADEIDNADDYEPFKNRTESAPLGWTDWAIEAAIQSSGVITDRLRARAAEYRKAVQS